MEFTGVHHLTAISAAIKRIIVSFLHADARHAARETFEAALASYRQGRVVDAKRAREIIDAALGH